MWRILNIRVLHGLGSWDVRPHTKPAFWTDLWKALKTKRVLSDFQNSRKPISLLSSPVECVEVFTHNSKLVIQCCGHGYDDISPGLMFYRLLNSFDKDITVLVNTEGACGVSLCVFWVALVPQQLAFCSGSSYSRWTGASAHFGGINMSSFLPDLILYTVRCDFSPTPHTFIIRRVQTGKISHAHQLWYNRSLSQFII